MSFEYKEINGVYALKSSLFEKESGVDHFYSTRKGGTSEGIHDSLSFRYTGNTADSVHENFDRAAKVIGRSFRDVVRTQQVHRDKVCEVKDGTGYRIVALDNDGLVTNVKGVVLSGFYADCQVLLFYDKVNEAIGLCHSGWRGTAKDICNKTIDKMTELYGTNPSDLIVSIGPAICQDCFECDKDVYDAFIEAFGSEVEKYFIMKGVKYHPDVTAITVHRLKWKGVKAENIDVSGICTLHEDEELYWSHRRTKGNRGVHGAFITLK